MPKLSTVNDNVRRRAIEAAQRFASADKSDPFTFDRMITHLEVGIGWDHSGQGKSLHCYDAEKSSEERETPLGDKYHATVFRNLTRA